MQGLKNFKTVQRSENRRNIKPRKLKTQNLKLKTLNCFGDTNLPYDSFSFNSE